MNKVEYSYTIKDIQNAEKEVLKTFHDVCTSYNLPYSIMAGTLLGAIRHNGFIPWDNDIDVAMPRDAFTFLCMHWKEILPNDYYLQFIHSDKNVHLSFARLRKNGTALSNRQTNKWFMHQGVFIDIFPHDTCSSFKNADNIRKQKNRLESLITRKISPYAEPIFDTNIPNKGLKTIFAKCCSLSFLRYCLFNCYKGLHGNKYYVDINCKYGTKNGFFGKDLFDDLILVQFDELKVFAFSCYDTYLKITYGDYMKIPDNPKNELHEYTFIKLE